MTDSVGMVAASSRDNVSPMIWPALASFVVAAMAGALSYFWTPTNVDVSWLFVACARLLEGAQLHVEIIEVNPPFSIWLYMPFALAEHATGLPAELWLAIGLPLFALLSIGLCAKILGRAGVLGAGAAWLAPATLTGILLLFPGDFGQREQFAVVALLPWLALLAARDRRHDFSAGTAAEQLAAGVGAGMFVVIKPPLSVLALVLPALFLCAGRRSLRPLFTAENLIGATLSLAYLAWLAAFHRVFFTELLPMLRDLYLPVRMPILQILQVWPVTMLAGLLAATFAIARPGPIDHGARLMLLAALGYLPAFVFMGKGWTYQALPFVIFGIAGFFVQLERLQRRDAVPILAKAGIAAGLGLTGFVGLYEHINAYGRWSNVYQRADLRQAASVIESAVERPYAGTIATRMQPAHPLTRMVAARYISRYPSLWMIDNAEQLIGAAGAEAGQAAHLAALRDRFIEEVAQEIGRSRPDIIFDGGSQSTPGQETVHQSQAIQRVLGGYRVLYRDTVVTVFIRSDMPSGSPAGAGLPVP